MKRLFLIPLVAVLGACDSGTEPQSIERQYDLVSYGEGEPPVGFEAYAPNVNDPLVTCVDTLHGQQIQLLRGTEATMISDISTSCSDGRPRRRFVLPAAATYELRPDSLFLTVGLRDTNGEPLTLRIGGRLDNEFLVISSAAYSETDPDGGTFDIVFRRTR